jgi:starch synthase
MPLYLKTAYKTEALFANSSVVYTVFDSENEKQGKDRFFEKSAINNMSQADLEAYRDGDGLSMHKGACHFADAVIVGSEQIDAGVDYLSVTQDKPVLPWKGEEGFRENYLEFLRQLSEAEVS